MNAKFTVKVSTSMFRSLYFYTPVKILASQKKKQEDSNDTPQPTLSVNLQENHIWRWNRLSEIILMVGPKSPDC